MAIFVFSIEKSMGIAANMNEKLRNVVLVAGIVITYVIVLVNKF